MCLLTIAIWFILSICVVAISLITKGSNNITEYSGMAAIVLGMALPVVMNYWRPLVLRWAARKKSFQSRLLSEGVLNTDDLEKGARYMLLVEVRPGTEKKLPGTKQEAFLMVDNKTLRVFGDKTCFSSDNYRIIPGCTGRCSRCWVIWACGGDSFRLRATIDDKDREFLLTCREGRTLKQVARSTEMLEELVDVTFQPESESKQAEPEE